MRKMDVTLISKWEHCSQIVAGLLMLKQASSGEYIIKFHNKIQEEDYPLCGTLVEIEYLGKKIIYDLDDGYVSQMKSHIQMCDYYFKRSFSTKKNHEMFSEDECAKIYPLGLNYHVTYNNNPYDNFSVPLKKKIKQFFGLRKDSYYTPEKFEGKLKYKENNFKIIFFTRIWEEKPELCDEENKERNYINNMRIDIIRELKQRYGDNFIGGLKDTPAARKLAPDIISPVIYTERSRYLKLMHSSDICIGSMGLHESIGWKTAEYVAAAKAIVNEKFHYELPGNFFEGKNYLSYDSAKECIEKVEYLINNPEEMYLMKVRNACYYYEYVKPDVLVKRTLNIVEGKTSW